MAEDITIDYETSTISADGKPDSTGKDHWVSHIYQ